jgi:hypothetical protein
MRLRKWLRSRASMQRSGVRGHAIAREHRVEINTDRIAQAATKMNEPVQYKSLDELRMLVYDFLLSQASALDGAQWIKTFARHQT